MSHPPDRLDRSHHVLDREDRFEVAAISANWLAWLTGSALLAVKFRRTLRLT